MFTISIYRSLSSSEKLYRILQRSKIQLSLSTLNTQLTSFQNPQTLRNISSLHDVIHTLVPFFIAIFDTCFSVGIYSCSKEKGISFWLTLVTYVLWCILFYDRNKTIRKKNYYLHNLQIMVLFKDYISIIYKTLLLKIPIPSNKCLYCSNVLYISKKYIYIYIYIYPEQVLAETPHKTPTVPPPAPLSRKLFKLDEPDMQDTGGEAEVNS